MKGHVMESAWVKNLYPIQKAFGLGNYSLDELIHKASRSEHIFDGYAGRHRYIQINGSEAALTEYGTGSDVSEAQAPSHSGGLHFGHTGSAWIKVCVARTFGDESDTLSPYYAEVYPFYEPDSRLPTSFPILLMMTGRVPHIFPGTRLYGQVSMGCESVTKLSRAAKDPPQAPKHGLFPLYPRTGSDPDAGQAECLLRAEVLEANFLASDSERSPDRLRLSLFTPMGQLEAFYCGRDAVTLSQEIRKGDTAELKGWISLDCATGEYQDGPVRDAEHYARLIMGAIRNRQFKTITPSLLPEATLEVDGKIEASGSGAVTDWIRAKYEELFTERVGNTLNTWLTTTFATLCSEKNTWEAPRKGVLAVNSRDSAKKVFIEPIVDRDKKICSVRVLRDFSGWEIEKEIEFDVWRGFGESLRMADSALEEKLWAKKAPAQRTCEARAAFGLPSYFIGRHDESILPSLISLFDTEQNFEKAGAQIFKKTQIFRERHSRRLFAVSGSPGFFFLLEKDAARKKLGIQFAEPLLEGITVRAQCEAVYMWLGLPSGEIALQGKNWGRPLSAYCAAQGFTGGLEPGRFFDFKLSGILSDCKNIPARTIKIDKGPFYEHLLIEFLKENPGKTAADFPYAEVETEGMFAALPSKWDSYHNIVSVVKEAEEMTLGGEPVWKVRMPVLRTPDGDVDIYGYARRGGAWPPKIGKNFACTVFLMAERVRK